MFRISVLCHFFTALVLPAIAVGQQQSPTTPIEFLQRQDVSQELNASPQQLELANRLQPICDAQCEARMMQLFADSGTSTQTQFLALSPEQQQSTVETLRQSILEEIESEQLADNIFNPAQAIRFQQLRTQFRGLASLLDQRVGNLMGIDQGQLEQLQEIQDAGAGLIDVCQGDSSLSPEQRQAQIQIINNVLIDQSINILNDSQIDIFVDLSGSTFNFNNGPPSDENDAPNNPTSGENETPSQGSGPRPQTADPTATPAIDTSRPRSNSPPNNRRSGPIRRQSQPSNGNNIGPASSSNNSPNTENNQGSQRR